MIVCAPLVAAWCVVAIGSLAAATGLPIAPWPIVGVSIVMTILVVRWVQSHTARDATPVPRPWLQVAGIAAVISAVGVYVAWLAWPTMYAIAAGPDLVHHLTLIRFIQTRQTLPDDPIFGAYLGEMTGYPPGSHVVAAIAGALSGRDGVAIVHPIMAVATLLKAGILVSILGRILPAGRTRTPAAVAGVVLLLVPHAYLLSPIVHYGFYAQVLSEVFALAMWWACIRWHQTPVRPWLWLAAMFGIGIVLTWPVFLPVPLLTGAAIAAGRWDRSRRDRVADLAIVMGPVALLTTAFTLARAGSAGILSSGGDVLTPSIDLFGVPFLALLALGVVACSQDWRRYHVVGLFVALGALQVVALIVLQQLAGATNPYLGFKSMHLLVFGLVVTAAIGAATAWQAAVSVVPAGWRAGFDRAAWLIPVLLFVALWQRDLPSRPLASPLTAPVHQAGEWSRAHVPSNCVDYLVPHWLTAYWLHLDVLGNARASARVSADPYDFRRAMGQWIGSGSMQHAIVQDWDRVPAEARAHMRVLASFGPAAVVERSDGRGTCHDATPPIDDVGR